MALNLLPDDDSEPMPLDELQPYGDDLLRKALRLSKDAVLSSVRPEFVISVGSYKMRDVMRIRTAAREAAAAWSKVDGLLTELINEAARSTGGRPR